VRVLGQEDERPIAEVHVREGAARRDEGQIRAAERRSVRGSGIEPLLWALGFAADRMYPVRVVCHGCPPEIQGTDVASIQRKAAGHEITTPDISGWEWPELDLVDPRVGGAPKAQRDALALLACSSAHRQQGGAAAAALLDSRATKEEERDGLCQASVMMVHDLGLTFGHANTFKPQHRRQHKPRAVVVYPGVDTHHGPVCRQHAGVTDRTLNNPPLPRRDARSSLICSCS
jgi:hypothetical protein